jgi:large subunit ribosomal protein L21
VFERVLATKGADASSLAVGHPYVKGAKVHAQVLEHFKDKKIIVFKMKAKKHYRKKMGHRQAMTRFLVTDVQYN